MSGFASLLQYWWVPALVLMVAFAAVVERDPRSVGGVLLAAAAVTAWFAPGAVVSAGRTAVETLGPAGASVAALAAVGGVVGFSWWALDVE